MVNEEVENILLEIRERVRARELPKPVRANPPTETDLVEPFTATRERLGNSDTAAIVDSYLTTTARAWDRLPPVVSNRTGAIANCELWLKRQIKRMTHWFTWEQVNYNAAVHHALLSTLQVIAHNEEASAKQLADTREEIQRSVVNQREAVQEIKVQLKALGEELSQDLSRELSQLSQELSQQKAMIEEQRASQVAAQRKEMDARLVALTQEFNVRFEQLLEEQRVCFKQLSLEATEEAVLEDRARRKSDKLMEELKIRVDKIEKR